MAKNSLIFKDSEMAKNAIMDSQKKEIAALYENWASEISERAKYYSRKSTASSVVSERQMRELKKQLRTTSQQVKNEINGIIKNNMYMISDAVVADNVKWLQSFGFSADGLNAAFNYVPDSVVRNIVTGQIYDSGWSLSKAIWSDNEKALKDVYGIVAKGVAQNMPIYDIAKNLEAYVSPSKRKLWNLKASDGVKIYKKSVDYNAQRLARTLVQHSYQQSFIATTQKNPFVIEYIWHSNGSRVCPLCEERDNMVFQKGDLPMDHPNGMCVMEPVIAEDINQQLVDWFNSPDGTYPEIDGFAENFGYKASTTNLKGSSNSVLGVNLNAPHLEAFSKKFQDVLPEWADRIKNSDLPDFTELFDFYKSAETTADKELAKFMNDLASNVQSYKDISPERKEAYANIFSVVSKPHETTLYRGESGVGVERFGGFEKGKVIKFDSFGFTSPSMKTPSAHSGVLFEFQSGTPSINFPGQDAVDNDELILGNFEIVDVINQSNGVPRVILKYLK